MGNVSTHKMPHSYGLGHMKHWHLEPSLMVSSALQTRKQLPSHLAKSCMLEHSARWYACVLHEVTKSRGWCCTYQAMVIVSTCPLHT